MDDSVFTQVDALLEAAHQDGRHTLYEHEVYEMLRLMSLQTPIYRFVKQIDEVTDPLLAVFGGKDIMVKIVSRDMAHNQRYGGVKKVSISEPLYIRFVLAQMQQEVLSHFPEGQKPQIDGFLLIEFIHLLRR